MGNRFMQCSIAAVMAAVCAWGWGHELTRPGNNEWGAGIMTFVFILWFIDGLTNDITERTLEKYGLGVHTPEEREARELEIEAIHNYHGCDD